MAYGLEIREKVLSYLAKGHSQEEAVEIFGICRKTIYNWSIRKDLKPILNHTKGYKIDKKELENYIKDNPDKFLKEIAEEFNVKESSVCTMLKKLGYSNKKKKRDI